MRLLFQAPAPVKFLHNSGLYIHIPFCESKCAYCNFYSVFKSDKLIDEYLSALKREIKKWGGQNDRLFDTVYIGGGTPSVLNGKIYDLIACIKENFNISADAEITAELNPNVSNEFLFSAEKSGVNRISLGVQSGNDTELSVLGRKHTANEAKETVKRIKSFGFSNISADLMIALPDSNLDTLKENLDFMLSLDVPHISSYILKIEEKTKFYKENIQIPNEDEQANQYLFMCDYLEKSGYSHYEISNFSKIGYESRHNLKYWNCEEYLGLGPSAHSFFDTKRFYYPGDIKEFIKNPNTVFDCTGGSDEEKIMLGLRLKSGINLKDYKNRKLENRLTMLYKAKLINKDEMCISLTDKGMLVSNSIISNILECIYEDI